MQFTLTRVAQLVGVSTSTASRYLRGQLKVQDETATGSRRPCENSANRRLTLSWPSRSASASWPWSCSTSSTRSSPGSPTRPPTSQPRPGPRS
ncbi:LacI family DNA-binding transcriptional regulator [Saccharopolyspora sp. ASAGF58]|uniref:LacI family DNA-binding transcriptional regulator n=1 Tax=Saccharopolyspora sp. ASAGF58 TaxID=2719023 RepID=UPI0035300CA3